MVYNYFRSKKVESGFIIASFFRLLTSEFGSKMRCLLNRIIASNVVKKLIE